MVREAIDRIYGHYLEGRGKRRWCDKSLDSYQFADLVAQGQRALLAMLAWRTAGWSR